MAEEWVRSILAECRRAAVPFFFKQWGGVQKGRRGRLLDGRTYDEMPARREVAEGRSKSSDLPVYLSVAG